ncbi:MAG: ATP synthase F1 subunit delta [Patescibacteria group bacterium]
MTKISLRYARALLLATGEQVEDLKKVADDLDIVAEVLVQAEAQSFLTSPEVTVAQKDQLIDKAFGQLNKASRNFLKLVIKNGKVRAITEIAESFRAVVAETAGLVTAKVESATPLEEAQIQDLIAALQKMTGKEVAIETSENPRLLGGVKVLLGDEVIDLSLAGKLQKLGQTLG